ncbi:SusC/RagA family TonB-linked outer membrane protein [Robertkochia solimangrovi]|uniref:SusC/RagA family TonB-linked outer membrane protein n=1 Tax=Robertkochia solimangrovi TaxID=2213046 RepID=UPI0011801D4B|nr:TonB-dependent receptor [Robertkochia solimangrovi]TRZ43085.1 SusC/RagA family TonB-linked outer membrane protein [Robertkochia solimangrovi]
MKSKFTWILTLFLAFGLQFSFAQEKTISGTVTDQDGLPLPGANVSVKGTARGTQTDFDGNYSLSASVGEVLTFSYIGQKSEERTVGTSSTINVQLMADSQALEEVVVLGYATTNKAELTGSTVQLNAEAIEQAPVASVDQVLQGKVAGLVITNSSGTPGSTTDIRIRGISSITAGNEPLYVIDGVPVVNNNVSATSSGSSLSPLASINPNNIESMTVLKDASATAAYGARGANGVIVITTKTGKSGKTVFNLSTSYGFSNDATDGPTVLTGAQREMLFYEALYNTYGAAYDFDIDGAQAFYEANTGSFGNDYVVWNAAGRPEAHWADVVTNRDAPIQEYNLSASGGDETSNFFASLGYYKQEATVIGSDFDRITGQLNFSKQLSPAFRFSTTNSASHSYQDGLLETSAYFSSPRTIKFFQPPIEMPYNEDGSINLNTTLPNPLWIAQEDIDDSKFTRIITNNSLTWDTPVENLSFTTRVNIDYQVYNYKRYRNRIDGDGSSTNGYGWQANRNRANYVFQNSVDYTWNVSDDHSFDFKVLQEYQKNRLYYLEADGDSFGDDGLTNLNSAGNPTTANSWYTDWAVASYMGLMHYSAFNGRYVFDATYRREGNSRFASDNRWGNFWSVGGAWNIHRESFLEGSNLFSNLKLRASYGVTGNANIDLNQYQALLNYDSDYAGEGASYPGTFGNNDLSWETSHTYDIGIEMGFFRNRITANVGYYNRESKDLLLDVPLSLTTGFTSQTRNIGRMENKGIEVEANFEIIRSNDFNLSIGGNFASNNNEVLELAKDAFGEEINITNGIKRVETGHTVYEWYMPSYAGVDPDTGVDLWYTDGEGSETTTTFSQANSVYQGSSALPTFTAGMNFHIDVKGFFLDAQGYYAGGHKVYEDWARYTNGRDLFTLLYYNGVDAILDRWQQPGDTGTRFGKMEFTTFPWQRDNKFLYDGDFFRLRNVTFGYDFNQDFLDTIGFSAARVFVRGTNMFTWVKDDRMKYDPETDATGYLKLATPPVKSVVFGVNLKF